MPSTWAGTSDHQLVTQAAAIDAVANNELAWIITQPASWNQPGRVLSWRQIIDHIRTLPGAPDGRDPNEPPPVIDPIMERCPAKQEVINWRHIVTVPTVAPSGLAVVRGTNIIPPDVRAVWSTTGVDSSWNITVEWYINSVLVDVEGASGQAGMTPLRFVDYGDSIYVRAWFNNSAGSGPVAQSSPLIV